MLGFLLFFSDIRNFFARKKLEFNKIITMKSAKIKYRFSRFVIQTFSIFLCKEGIASSL